MSGRFHEYRNDLLLVRRRTLDRVPTLFLPS